MRALTHWEAEQDLRIRIKKAFDEEKIEIPFARQAIYLRHENGASQEIRVEMERF
ncbi:MAG: mechanosensitive ion channel family protein [Candidatus Tectomicrobia bacterium]|nr:mechanosensitive ion channel family protein [Candidatus Tectomicrobia bacterium]